MIHFESLLNGKNTHTLGSAGKVCTLCEGVIEWLAQTQASVQAWWIPLHLFFFTVAWLYLLAFLLLLVPYCF